jgi:plastocyanin
MNVPGRLLFAFAALALSAGAHARDITVAVRDGTGHPVEDAVVLLDAPGRAPPPGHFTINQKDTMFVPFVLVIPVGSTVDFTNLDPFRHHVYSFSPAKKFELKLFGKGEKRSVTFNKPGTIALGCNIHDTMQAFIQVVDTVFAAKTGRDGHVVLHGAPSGATKVLVWHPHLRAPGNLMTVVAQSGGDVTLPVSVKLRRPAPMSHDY